MGILFIIAAVSKLFAVNHFIEVIIKFDILPITIIPFFALFIIFIEYVLGILLVLGIFIRYAVPGLLLLMSVFIFATLINIFRGNFVECGCFGNILNEKIGWYTLFRDFLIVGLILLIKFKSQLIYPNSK